MAILSTRQAVRLGRPGGKVSAVDRKGNSEWGRRAQRQRAAKAQKLHHPGLYQKWAANANAVRWGKPLPFPDLPDVAWALRGVTGPPSQKARTHYQRECPTCRQAWTSSRCPHDQVQEPCPFCHWTPQPVRTPVMGGCECRSDV